MSTYQRLADRVAIVTGSSSGIGRAICQKFHAEGASLICADIHPSPAGGNAVPTHELIANAGGKAVFVKTDVALASDVEALVAAGVKKYGKVDIVVNNAGIFPELTAPANPIDAASIGHFEDTMRVNTRGVFFGARFAVAQMKNQQPHASGVKGWVLNVASIAALGGIPGLPGYSASKGAVMAMTRSIAMDVAKDGIICNTIVPGFVETGGLEACYDGFLKGLEPQQLAASIPLQRLGKPDDIGRAAVFLVSDDAAWVTGTSLVVDGGQSAK